MAGFHGHQGLGDEVGVVGVVGCFPRSENFDLIVFY